MSIQSMTGFGSGEYKSNRFVVTVEVKSVNHRFRDVRFKIPLKLSSIELDFRKLLSEKFKRGSFDVFISYKSDESTKSFSGLDYDMMTSFLKKMNGIAKDNDIQFHFTPSDVLRSEFYLLDDGDLVGELGKTVFPAFQAALESLESSRTNEGKKLTKVIIAHKNEFTSFFEKIEGLSGLYQENLEEKIKNRLASLEEEIKIDNSRFCQEIVYYLEKLDVHEEINRIKSHLDKFDQLMKSSGEVGRQIDFLIQELNRETNTIGSKSGSSEISDAVVQMKVQLEKIREQGLNME